MNKTALLEKIFLLESNLGKKYSHSNLEPYSYNTSDILGIQTAGKRISEFIGLKGLTFIISYSNQKKGVGGHIELGSKSEVFIEIDESYKTNSSIVSAILAHEICHKYLQLNNIKLFPEHENEVLTDIATVYTGLGKLSLNGCETITQSRSFNGQKTTITTATNTVGYLSRAEFSFVFKMICTMREVPQNLMYENLSNDAVNAVKNIEATERSYFDKRFFDDRLPRERFSRLVQNQLSDSQIDFAILNKNIREVEGYILNLANKLDKAFHSSAKTEIEKIEGVLISNSSSGPYNYIKNIIVLERIESLVTKIREMELHAKSLLESLSAFTSLVKEHYPKEYEEKSSLFLFQFSCPSCNNKMRISDNKIARVKCPRCGYSFIANTGVDTNAKKLRSKNPISLAKNLKGLFKKK